jgi:two-component system cell cycle sensor histidine kinase/response regulator CckA
VREGERLNEDGHQLRALVIDDEPAIRALVTDLLTILFDADVDTADGGATGLELFSKGRYDLVLTDLLMPDMLGWEVTETLQRWKPDVRMIILTGSASSADARRAREAGIRLVTKPVTIADFKQAIGDVLSGEPSPATASEAQHGAVPGGAVAS